MDINRGEGNILLGNNIRLKTVRGSHIKELRIGSAPLYFVYQGNGGINMTAGTAAGNNDTQNNDPLFQSVYNFLEYFAAMLKTGKHIKAGTGRRQ